MEVMSKVLVGGVSGINGLFLGISLGTGVLLASLEVLAESFAEDGSSFISLDSLDDS